MNPVWRLGGALLVVCCALVAHAQVELKITEILPVAYQGRTAILSPVKCDADGNIYMQLPDPQRYLGGPLLKIFPGGKAKFQYSVGSIPGMQDASVVDFAVGSRGELYLLASGDENGAYIIRLDNEGNYASKIKLGKDLLPTRIGVFGTGDFLLTGWAVAPAIGSSIPAPASALFDTRGQLLKEVVLSKDVKPAKPRQKDTSRAPDKEYDMAVSGSFMESADDGNVYLARRSPKGPVYVISPSGEVLRTIQLKPPANAELSDIRISHGRLVAMFLRKKGPEAIDRVIFSVIDLQTKNIVAQYEHSSARLGGALACYTPDTFTFLTMGPDEGLEIARAEAR